MGASATIDCMRSKIAPPFLVMLTVFVMSSLIACRSGAVTTPTITPSASLTPTERPGDARGSTVPIVPAGPSSAPSVATPAGSSSTSTPGPSASPVASPNPESGEPRVIELEETAALEITLNGKQITDIPVTPGETIHFVVTNAAGFDHNFYIGTDGQLAASRVEGLPGLPTWSSEVPQAYDWTVPQDIAGLNFGCTLRGHYPRMRGTFSVKE